MLSKPEYLDLQSKANTFDRIMRHLKNVKIHETRKRELARAKIAMRNIGNWFREEEEKLVNELFSNG